MKTGTKIPLWVVKTCAAVLHDAGQTNPHGRRG